MPWNTPLLTLDEVAEYLRVDMELLMNLIIKGDLLHVRVGSEIRIKPEDLWDWEQRHTYPRLVRD